MAFRMASMATPTSANTASQRVAMPQAPNASTANLMPNARTIFCQTMRRVCRPARMAVAIFDGCVASQSAHGYAHVAQCQRRRIVDAVAHEGYTPVGVFSQCLDVFYFPVGQQVAIGLCDAYPFCKVSNNLLFVSRKHLNICNAQFSQGTDGLGGIVFQRVGQ